MKTSIKYVLTSIASIIVTLTVIILAVYFVKNSDKKSDKKDDNKTPINRTDDSSNRNVSLKYAGKVHVDINNKKVKFYFSNPEQSNRDVKLDIILLNGNEEVTISANSSLVKPGDVVENLDYIGPSDINKGQYDGKFKVKFYNSKGIEEVLNSVINVTVFVE